MDEAARSAVVMATDDGRWNATAFGRLVGGARRGPGGGMRIRAARALG